MSTRGSPRQMLEELRRPSRCRAPRVRRRHACRAPRVARAAATAAARRTGAASQLGPRLRAGAGGRPTGRRHLEFTVPLLVATARIGGMHDPDGGRTVREGALLGCQQPPVGGLAPVAQLELDRRRVAVRSPIIAVAVRRAPVEDADQFGPAPSRRPRQSDLSTARSVACGSPQATTSSSTKPTASPRWKRPAASSRAAGATEPVRMPASAWFSARRSPRACVRGERDARRRGRPAGCVASDQHLLVGELARRAGRP